MKKSILSSLSALMLLILIIPALASNQMISIVSAQGSSRTFPETGKTVQGKFLDYWNNHGGLAQQGYPISDEMQEVSDVDGKTYTVQYFERAVFELHPENAAPYDVLLSLLGVFSYSRKYPSAGGAPGQQPSSQNARLFSETGKRVGGVFLAYWNTHGALAQQGLPISDEFTETSDLDGKQYRVQYFERAVFELHPENAPPYNVLLSQLGKFRYAAKYSGNSVTGHITYSLADGTVYRLEAQDGAKPQDISQALNALSPGGSDKWLNTSPDGQWLLMETGRFDPQCADNTCLAVVKGDLSAGEAVLAGGQLVHPSGFGAISSDGNRAVYPGGDGAHTVDLWAVTRSGGAWSAPVILTGGSSYDYNSQPAISADGSKVVFDCGTQPYGAEGTAICEVGTDGQGFRVLLTPADSPAGLPKNGALHHPAYAPDGSVVFEGNWGSEAVWRMSSDGKNPARITSQFNNDNSPCVLPDGRIVSLWLDRPGNSSTHEIKVMSANGSSYFMALTGVDVLDTGIGCGR